VLGNQVGDVEDINLGNGQLGVGIFDAQNNTIGTGLPTGFIPNIITGNGAHGVQISGPNATGNVVQGNRIGAAAGRDLGNTHIGVAIFGASSNTIGATFSEGSNIISGNGR